MRGKFIIANKVVAAAISSKLIFLKDEKDFIEKELADVFFDINYLKLI